MNTPPPLPPGANPAPAKTSVMAILSLVFGILGLVTCVTAVPGLILGIIAIIKVSNSKGALRGQGLALAGIIISVMMLLIAPALLLPAFAAAKLEAQAISCVNNEKQLMWALRLYAGDHNGQFPPAATWCDAINVNGLSEIIFKCNAANSGRRCDYAYNSKVGGLYETNIAPDTVVIFESDGGWNANGGPELFIGKARHKAYSVAFADGHVEHVTQTGLSTLRWDP